jgi:hypothetical protein
MTVFKAGWIEGHANAMRVLAAMTPPDADGTPDLIAIINSLHTRLREARGIAWNEYCPDFCAVCRKLAWTPGGSPGDAVTNMSNEDPTS